LQSAVGSGTDVRVSADSDVTAVTGEDADASIQYLLLILIVGFAAVAVVNTLIMSTADRAQELATLRLAGATPAQIGVMFQCESAFLTILGATFGTAISLAVLAAFSPGVVQSGPSIPALPYTAIIGGAAALSQGATAIAVPA
jgi:putative ABC transport system permease protein